MRSIALRLFLVLFTTVPLFAQRGEVTPFVGWQEGGAVSIGNESADLEGAPAFGVFVTLDRGPGRMLDVVLSHHATDATAETPLFGRRTIDVSVTYIHVGGRYYLRRDERVSPYIAATLGASYFSLEGGDALRPSAAAGAGFDLPLSPAFSLRFDGRFWFTLVDPRTEIACQGGTGVSCVAFTDTSVMAQFTLSGGLVFRF
jgi:hypothetical protein